MKVIFFSVCFAFQITGNDEEAWDQFLTVSFLSLFVCGWFALECGIRYRRQQLIFLPRGPIPASSCSERSYSNHVAAPLALKDDLILQSSISASRKLSREMKSLIGEIQRQLAVNAVELRKALKLDIYKDLVPTVLYLTLFFVNVSLLILIKMCALLCADFTTRVFSFSALQ